MQGCNPHAPASTAPAELVGSLWRNRQLIAQMSKREVVGRYRGSVMGLAWSFFHPIFLLSVYTFVFFQIFGTKWGGAAEVDGQSQFTLILFVGMTVLGLFSEVINKAPSLIFSNVNYVKKVVFPIEILPVVSMVVALFHALISICVILVAMLSTTGKLYVTAILLPVVFFPLITLTLGAAWFLASLGVFLRDVGQTIGLITTALMFLSPVFYPVSAVPERFQFLLLLNPLTFVIEQSRHILIWGYSPDWIGLAQYTLFSVFFAWAGFAWFQKTRRGFADVL